MAIDVSALDALRFFFKPMAFEVHTVEFVADDDFATMPSLFVKRCYNEVPEDIVLTDPVGNQFYVICLKHRGTVIIAGWMHVGHFYGLTKGGDIRMIYLGSDKFLIQVLNQDGHKVIYPPLPIPEVTVTTPDDDETGSMTDSNMDEEREYSLMYMHTITHEDATRNVLALPYMFSLRAFPLKSCEIKLVDQKNKEWGCFLNIETGRRDSCNVTGCWAKFRTDKHLVEGNTMLLCVTRAKSQELYYIKNM